MVKRYHIHKVKRLCSWWVALALVAGTLAPAHAQRAVSEIQVDAISVRLDDGSSRTRLDLYTEVPYAYLTFINTPNGFTATYEVAADIYKLDDRNRRQSLVLTRIWESTAVADAFNTTQSHQAFDYTTHSLELDPGRYLLELQITDNNAQDVFVREWAVVVRDLSGAVAVSDLILLDDFDETTNTIFPRVSTDISSELFGFEIFYEIYADRPQTVRVTREAIPMRKHGSALVRTGRTLLGLGDDDDDDPTAVYIETEEVALQRGRHQTVVHIPTDNFTVGDYLVRIRVENPAGRTLATSERIFTSHWTGLADHLTDLDNAINQLQYIAKTKELQEIKAAETRPARLERFTAFWKKRDPTPSTERNESMEEYYYRIAYANREYGNVMEGWKTDRGQVVVSFGQPDDVVRHPFNFNVEPYEVWYYYRIGRKFIFVDKTGFGDFELLRPIWDEQNRLR